MGVKIEELAKIHENLYRINFCFLPDSPTIREVWEKDGKRIEIFTTSPWACKDEEDEMEWRWIEFEKRKVEEFLEWLGFEPVPEED